MFFFESLYVGRFGVVVVTVGVWFLVTDWLRRAVGLGSVRCALLLDFFEGVFVFFDRNWDFFDDTGAVLFVFVESFTIENVFNLDWYIDCGFVDDWNGVEFLFFLLSIHVRIE